MRLLSYICWLSAFFVGIGGAIFYASIITMGCSLSKEVRQEECDPPAPWELRGEDLIVMVIMPTFIFLGLVCLAIYAGRRARKKEFS